MPALHLSKEYAEKKHEVIIQLAEYNISYTAMPLEY